MDNTGSYYSHASGHVVKPVDFGRFKGNDEGTVFFRFSVGINPVHGKSAGRNQASRLHREVKGK